MTKQRRPVFLWIIQELIQDNRWEKTHFARLPLEVLVHIFEHKWFLEKGDVKEHLEQYFFYLINSFDNNRNRRFRDLRSVCAFNLNWNTPNDVNVRYLLKWGPGFIIRELNFSKNLRITSQHVQYDKPNPQLQINMRYNIIPSFTNNFGLPISIPSENSTRYGATTFSENQW